MFAAALRHLLRSYSGINTHLTLKENKNHLPVVWQALRSRERERKEETKKLDNSNKWASCLGRFNWELLVMCFEKIPIQYTTRILVMRGIGSEIVLMGVEGSKTGKTNQKIMVAI